MSHVDVKTFVREWIGGALKLSSNFIHLQSDNFPKSPKTCHKISCGSH